MLFIMLQGLPNAMASHPSKAACIGEQLAASVLLLMQVELYPTNVKAVGALARVAQAGRWNAQCLRICATVQL